jgi:hypothetical protein
MHNHRYKAAQQQRQGRMLRAISQRFHNGLSGPVPAVAICSLCFLAVVGAVIFARTALAFEFPLPWPDESAFVSQAFALERTGSLAVYALNPDRTIMWMPPGYMVLLAVIFKLFGYSFGLARWVSSILFIAAYGCTLIVINRLLTGWKLAIVAIFSVSVFLTPFTIVDANVARMESLYTFLFLAALLVSMRGMPAIGACIVVATAVVHFNAVYFTIPFVVFGLFCLFRRQPIALRRRDLVAMALSALIIGSYGIFCFENLSGFQADMQYQFQLKASHPFRGDAADIALMILLLIVPLVQITLRRAFTPAVFVSLFGAAFFFMALYGQEMWYRFGFMVGLLLTGAAIASDATLIPWRAVRVLLYAGVTFLGWAETIYGYSLSPATAPLGTLMHQRIVSKGDRKAISAFLRRLPPGSLVSFGYGFDGIEPFFLDDLARAGAVWTMHFHSATQFGPPRSADYRVRCDSSLYRMIINPAADGDYPRQGRDSGCTIIKLHPK